MSLAIREVVLLVVIVTACCVCAQNIDTFVPIVRDSPEGNDITDYFGYSIAMHEMVLNGGADQSRVIVSAPLGQADGSQLPRTDMLQSTGVVYVCPIEPGLCKPLLGDGQNFANRLYDMQNNERRSIVDDQNVVEEKRGQFLGATLRSTGETFMACAHRRQDFGSGADRSPYGVCYYSGRSLLSFMRYDPCSTTRSRSFFGFGQCQAGTSGAIIDSAPGSRSIMLGLPGAHTWRGAISRIDGDDPLFPRFSMPGVGTGQISWQGYEVITGCITNPGVKDFIVSVPRFNNYLGRVNIYANNNDLTPVGNPPLAGDQVGAYYGFSLAAVDFTGTGRDDLLVGAPMYSTDVTSPEVGRVYIYRNVNGNLQFFATITGTIRYGRYGHAMARLGDINGDGFEDVAISAPFGEVSDSPVSGTVYIYSGIGGTALFDRANPQVIVGSELNLADGLSNLRSFGSSISSNIDVDSNGLTDLAIGAYLSRQLFVLRARPVATLSVVLNPDRSIDANIQTCMVAGFPNRACFNIQVCMQYGGTGTGNMLMINTTLVGDAQTLFIGLPSRVQLTSELNANTVSGRSDSTLQLTSGVEQCINEVAYLELGATDIRRALSVEFGAVLAEVRQPDTSWNGNGSVVDLSSAPILAISGATSMQTEFLRNCSGNVCIPDLNVNVKENDIIFESLNGSVVSSDSVISEVVSSLNITVTVVNNGNDAYSVDMTTSHSSLFSFVRAIVDGENVPLDCVQTTGNANSSVQCRISPLLPSNNELRVVYRFRAIGIQGSEGTLIKTFRAFSVDAEIPTTEADNIHTLQLNTSASADIFVQAIFQPASVILGETNPELDENSTISDFASEALAVEGMFVVRNIGPSTIPNARLRIRWPLVSNADPNARRFYLYPTSIDGASCETAFINELGLGEVEGSLGGENSGLEQKRRKRRQSTGPVVTSSTNVSCREPNPACVEIMCNVTTITSSSSPVITIRAYPDNRFFYQTQEDWLFEAFADITIVESYIGEPSGHRSNSDVAVLEGVSAATTGSDNSIPAWAIVVPIVIGVIIIIVIVVILYFVGFFKLKKVDKDQDELTENGTYESPDGEKPEATNL